MVYSFNYQLSTFNFQLFEAPLRVVPGRLELPTSTLSVWRSNQLSYRTVQSCRIYDYHKQRSVQKAWERTPVHTFIIPHPFQNAPEINVRRVIQGDSRKEVFQLCPTDLAVELRTKNTLFPQKGGVPAAPSGTATLLRLSPNHQFHPRPPLAVADFRCPRLSWLDGRCVQGPGTYSPRHG